MSRQLHLTWRGDRSTVTTYQADGARTGETPALRLGQARRPPYGARTGENFGIARAGVYPRSSHSIYCDYQRHDAI